MPVAFTMKGSLEAITIEEDFPTVLNSLQTTAIQGKEFAVGTMQNGQAIGISMRNIIDFRELDSDYEPMIGASS